MIGEFERKLVDIYTEKNYPELNWICYEIKDYIMTITYRDKYSELSEVSITFNELIDSCK